MKIIELIKASKNYFPSKLIVFFFIAAALLLATGCPPLAPALLEKEEIQKRGIEDLTQNEIAPPAGFTVSRGEYADKITLSWQPVEGAARYKINRESALNGLGIGDKGVIDSTSLTSYEDVFDISLISTDPDFSVTRYFYTVQAVTVEGKDGSEAGPKEGFFLLPPARIEATGNATAITLTWDSVEGAEKYEIRRSRNPQGSDDTLVVILDATGGDTQAYSDNPDDFGRYYYTVVSLNTKDGGQSTDIAPLKNQVFASGFSVNPLAPRAPLNLVAGKGEHLDRIRLTWEASAPRNNGVVSYKIYRADTDNPVESLIAEDIADLFYEDNSSALQVGKEYYYSVQAVEKLGSNTALSPPSGLPNGFIDPAAGCLLAPPTALTAVKTGATATPGGAVSVDLDWNPVRGAPGYKLYTYAGEPGSNNFSLADSRYIVAPAYTFNADRYKDYYFELASASSDGSTESAPADRARSDNIAGIALRAVTVGGPAVLTTPDRDTDADGHQVEEGELVTIETGASAGHMLDCWLDSAGVRLAMVDEDLMAPGFQTRLSADLDIRPRFIAYYRVIVNGYLNEYLDNGVLAQSAISDVGSVSMTPPPEIYDGRQVYKKGTTVFLTINDLDISDEFYPKGLFLADGSAAPTSYAYQDVAGQEFNLDCVFTQEYAVDFGVADSGGAVTAEAANKGALTSGDRVLKGDEVTFTASRDTAGSRSLYHWNGADPGDTSRSLHSETVTVAQNITRLADFREQRTLTLNQTAGGVVSSDARDQDSTKAGIQVWSGVQNTIAISTENGYMLDYWVDDDSGLPLTLVDSDPLVGGYQMAIMADMNISPRFTAFFKVSVDQFKKEYLSSGSTRRVSMSNNGNIVSVVMTPPPEIYEGEEVFKDGVTVNLSLDDGNNSDDFYPKGFYLGDGSAAPVSYSYQGVPGQEFNLAAVFTQEHAVTFGPLDADGNANGGTVTAAAVFGGPLTSGDRVLKGDEVTFAVSRDPVGDHYLFRWNNTDPGHAARTAHSETVTIDRDTTRQALFKEQFTLAVGSGANGSADIAGITDQNTDKAGLQVWSGVVNTVELLADAGHMFDQWHDDHGARLNFTDNDTFEYGFQLSISADATIYPQFVPWFKVTIDGYQKEYLDNGAVRRASVSEIATVSMSPNPVIYEGEEVFKAGTTVTLTVNDLDSSDPFFYKGLFNTSDGASLSATLTGSVAGEQFGVTAVFTEEYTVTFGAVDTDGTANGGSLRASSNEQGSLTSGDRALKGDEITFNADRDPTGNYYLFRWNNADPGEAARSALTETVAVSADLERQAVFNQQVTLALGSAAGGTVTLPQELADLDDSRSGVQLWKGDQVTLNLSVDPKYVFDFWQDGNGDELPDADPATAGMQVETNADLTITPAFVDTRAAWIHIDPDVDGKTVFLQLDQSGSGEFQLFSVYDPNPNELPIFFDTFEGGYSYNPILKRLDFNAGYRGTIQEFNPVGSGSDLRSSYSGNVFLYSQTTYHEPGGSNFGGSPSTTRADDSSATSVDFNRVSVSSCGAAQPGRLLLGGKKFVKLSEYLDSLDQVADQAVFARLANLFMASAHAHTVPGFGNGYYMYEVTGLFSTSTHNYPSFLNPGAAFTYQGNAGLSDTSTSQIYRNYRDFTGIALNGTQATAVNNSSKDGTMSNAVTVTFSRPSGSIDVVIDFSGVVIDGGRPADTSAYRFTVDGHVYETNSAINKNMNFR